MMLSFKLLALLVISFLSSLSAQRGSYSSLIVPQRVLQLPELPYSTSALEPLLDAATLHIHHQGHHKAYCDKTNAALQEWRAHNPSDPLSRKSMVEILQHLPEVPRQWRTSIRNNGGGFVNHIIYWEGMCSPKTQGAGGEPTGRLARDIAYTFGSFSNFKSQFSNTSAQLFGSGYVWLCENVKGELSISATHNQDCPLTSGEYPLLVLDVWEHAYYLKHQNKRSEYIADWWGVVCWDYVSRLHEFWRAFYQSRARQEL